MEERQCACVRARALSTASDDCAKDSNRAMCLNCWQTEVCVVRVGWPRGFGLRSPSGCSFLVWAGQAAKAAARRTRSHEIHAGGRTGSCDIARAPCAPPAHAQRTHAPPQPGVSCWEETHRRTEGRTWPRA